MMRQAWLLLLTLVLASPAAAQQVDLEEFAARIGMTARQLVERAEDALRGDTAQMKATMTITTPRWTRELSFRSWDDRHNDRSFTRILGPKKDKGTGFLRVGSTLWTYLPRVERTTRIPPSMMLQSWMGSDFTNDDLARESSLIDDYTPSLIGEREIDGQRAWGAKLVPHEDAPVVWSKIEAWVAAESFAPLLYLYYDEPEEGQFELIRRMRFSDVRTVKGRPVPHEWVIEPLDKPGHSTAVRLDEMELDEPIAERVFTQDNLKRSEAVR